MAFREFFIKNQDINSAIALVLSNCSNIVFTNTVKGTAKIIPGIFHTYPQKNNITMIVTVLIENVFPIKIGSNTLPNNNCSAIAIIIKTMQSDNVGICVNANTHITAVDMIEPII